MYLIHLQSLKKVQWKICQWNNSDQLGSYKCTDNLCIQRDTVYKAINDEMTRKCNIYYVE